MDDRLSPHIELARNALASGVGLDGILEDLRGAGLSITDSIWTIRSVTGMSLTEAKLLIQESTAFSDVREGIIEDHGALRRLVKERMAVSSHDRERPEPQSSDSEPEAPHRRRPKA